MLALDVISKTTGQLAQVHCLYSNLTALASEQTIGFWEYLDRKYGSIDFSRCSEDDIGELYVHYHAEATPVSHDSLTPYLNAVDCAKWIHPSSARLNTIWASHLSSLGVRDPGISRPATGAVSTNELLDCLSKHDLILDLRPSGGALYLDATSDGAPLRQVISPEGRSNYLVYFLRDLASHVNEYDHVVLLHDPELTQDFLLVQIILERISHATVSRVVTKRVPINGAVSSARHGQWHGYTTSKLISKLQERNEPLSLRLGMRLYLVAIIESDRDRSFSIERLQRFIERADRLFCSAPAVPVSSLQTFLLRCARRRPYVDPYIVTSCLLSNTRPALTPNAESLEWYM
ncbi:MULTISPECIES: hypothetical protein [unclassified Bradyrhizobium]|uniref:hypothetical protein n=1 Tax=unclassified Bradyrhizobium TaxID=2631580 RepID=UPI0028E94DA9|nr:MULTISPECIES: hypothetical protein [unclassified Bradyrhizobium]